MNPAVVVSMDGIVASVDMGISQEFPNFTLALSGGTSVVVLTGPYYFLLEREFDIDVGDRVRTRAFPSLWHDGAYVAIEIENLTTGKTILLRDDDGRPLWTGQGTPGSGGMGDCHHCDRNQTTLATFEGLVANVHMGFSLEHPSFTLALDDGSTVTVLTGPYRFLVESGFTIAVGNRMRVEGFRSYWPDTTYVAVKLTNLTTGETLTLRSYSGDPVWTQHHGGPGGPNGERYGDCGGWIPPSGTLDVVTLEGTVLKIDMAIGQEFPTFTLALEDGRVVTILTGAYYYLLQSGFEIDVGDRMSVRAFLSMWYVDTYVAMELTNLTTGETITLRDAVGHPVWPGTQECGMNGIGYGGGAAWHGGGTPVVVKGKVHSVNARIGDLFTSVTLVKPNGSFVTVVLGPHWSIAEGGLTIRERDRLRIRAFPSGWFDGIYVAMEVKNRTRKQTMAFRDEAGRPLWH